MEIQLKKGLIEALVLAITKREDTYGYNLLKLVEDVMQVSESTLYPILRRLEAQGHLSTYQQEYNGRLRKYYKLTQSGFERLEEYKRNLQDMKTVMDEIFKGE